MRITTVLMSMYIVSAHCNSRACLFNMATTDITDVATGTNNDDDPSDMTVEQGGTTRIGNKILP